MIGDMQNGTRPFSKIAAVLAFLFAIAVLSRTLVGRTDDKPDLNSDQEGVEGRTAVTFDSRQTPANLESLAALEELAKSSIRKTMAAVVAVEGAEHVGIRLRCHHHARRPHPFTVPRLASTRFQQSESKSGRACEGHSARRSQVRSGTASRGHHLRSLVAADDRAGTISVRPSGRVRGRAAWRLGDQAWPSRWICQRTATGRPAGSSRGRRRRPVCF